MWDDKCVLLLEFLYMLVWCECQVILPPENLDWIEGLYTVLPVYVGVYTRGMQDVSFAIIL